MIIFFTFWILLPFQEPSKSPLPPKEAQVEAEKTIRDVFKEDLAQKTPVAQETLSKKFLAQAVETKDNDALRYVLLEKAADLAIAAGSVETLSAAVGTLSDVFRVSPSQKDAIYKRFEGTATKPPEQKRLAELRLLLAGEAFDQDLYDLSQQIAQDSLVLAKKAKDLPLAGRASAAVKSASDARADFEKARKAQGTLRSAPDDSAANQLWGEYLCYVKGDWEKGLHHLSKGTDQALKVLVEKDLSSPTEWMRQLEIADGWYDLWKREFSFQKQLRIGAHASVRYQQALPQATGINRAKTEKRLLELDPTSRKPPLELEIIVDALIDGDSILRVSPVGLVWDQFAQGIAAKPGKHQGRDEPTWVNGQQWQPRWGKPALNGGPDKTEPYLLSVGPVDALKCEVLSTGDNRNATGLENRDPIQTRVAGGEFLITITDSQPGPKWYKLRIHR